MDIKKLASNITEKNLAENMEESELMAIGQDVCEGHLTDWDSMQEWRDDIEEGLELISPATGSRSEPWEGAANFKTPILMEARLKFGDRASQELLKSDDLVKCQTVGKDPQGEKAKRIERVEAVMDWQLTVENPSWVQEQDKLLYDIATQGNMFKKVYFDPALGRNVSEVIRYPNFSINQSCETLEDAPRFTHRLFCSERKINTMRAAGVWRDCDIELGAKVSPKENQEGDDFPEAKNDKLTEFYEQQCWLDLDDDGISEPYIVTVHAASAKVMRIKAQYQLDDVVLMDEEGVTKTLDALLEREEDGEIMLWDGEPELTGEAADGDYDVIHIQRDKNTIDYGFIKNPKGDFLDVGYFHVLGAYCSSINSATNCLLDAGTLANLQGGWLAKGFRKKAGDIRVVPGEFQQTDISAQELGMGIRLYDLKEPSPTLMQLNALMNTEAQRLSSSADVASALGQNTQATTAMAIIYEAQEANGAIMLRIYRAMQREFGIWFKLNSKYIDPEQYAMLVDDEQADAFADFNTQDMDVMPASNPQSSSRLQRMQRAEAQISRLGEIAETGGNPQPVVKEWLDSIGSESIDQIYPELTPEQQEAMAAQEQQQAQMAEEERAIQLQATKDIGEAQANSARSKLIDSRTKAYQAASQIQKTDAEIDNKNADTLLKIEQAETEGTKNASNIFHAEIDQQREEREQAREEREQVKFEQDQRGGLNERRDETGTGGGMAQ